MLVCAQRLGTPRGPYLQRDWHGKISQFRKMAGNLASVGVMVIGKSIPPISHRHMASGK
jgi:hypothetical protein